MDFALTRKQLNKKREKDQAAASGQAPPAAPAAPAPAPPGTGSSPGVDPMTGLPAGYDPPAPTLSPGAGSEFFTSNAGVLGRQPAPVVSPPPAPDTFGQAPPPAPAFADLVAAPPAPMAPAPAPAAAPAFDALLPPSFGTPPQPAVVAPAGQPAVVAPAGQPPVAAAAPAPRPAPPAVGLIVGERPKGADLAMLVLKRYAGFVLFIVIAILLVAFLPSLRHSSTSPSGLGPVTTVAPAAAPTVTGGWSAGAGVVSVTTSYA